MKRYFRYFYLEIKRAFQTLPWLLTGAIALSLVTGAIAFCGYKLLYEKQPDLGLSAALVVEDTSPLAKSLLPYIENMEGLSGLLTFEETDRETGLARLKQDKVAAVFVIPENTVEGILDGTNTPAQVILKQDASLQAALLKELTLAGVRSLSAAQAGVYTVYDVYLENGLSASPVNAYTKLNISNLRFFANRNRLYRESAVSATGDLTTVQYYLASGIVLLLLLWGISMGGLFQSDSPSFVSLLAIQGIGSAGRCAAKTGSVFLLYLTGAVSLFALGAASTSLPAFEGAGRFFASVTGRAAVLGDAESLDSAAFAGLSPVTAAPMEPAARAAAVLCVLAVLLFVSSYTVFLYQCAPSRTGGILLIFLISVLLVFLSGGFIPPAFLPESLKSIGAALPPAVMIRQTGLLLGGRFQADSNSLSSILYLSACSVLLFVLSAAAGRLRSLSSGAGPAGKGDRP